MSKWNIQQWREKKVVFCSKRETNKRTERKRERETFLGSVRVWAHFVRCCVAVTSHPQPLLRRGHGCIVGVNQDPPVWCSHPGRMMREHQSASSLLAWLFVEWKLPVVSVAVDHWLSVNRICPPTGRKKNNDERERRPEKKEMKELRQRWLFLKKTTKRDQSKESKK